MSEDYEVGYAKPPKQHRFQKGNQAARGRRRKATPEEGVMTLPEILGKAWTTKRKIRRGEQVFELHAAEIMVERIVHIMTTGTAREIAMLLPLIERHLPHLLTVRESTIEVVFHRAPDSQIGLSATRSLETVS